MERFKTGIPGLDELLDGGFPKNSIIEISGSAGSTKSIFCLQCTVNAAKRGVKSLYITFDQPEESILQQAKQFWPEIDGLISSGKIALIRAYYPEVLMDTKHMGALKTMKKAQAVPKAFEDIEKAFLEHKPGFVVADSISALTDVINPEASEKREVVAELIEFLRSKNCNVLVTSELKEGDGLSSDGISEFLVDGLIKLSWIEAIRKRTITIKKMRATNTDLTPRSFVIGPGGIKLEKE